MTTKAGYVALIGYPNCGKSTLMNAILGTKLSIVSPKPQTTRKQILGIYTNENTQVIFFDTPGIIKPRYEMHKAMMAYVDEAILAADVITLMADLEEFGKSQSYFDKKLIEKLKVSGKAVLLLLNKIDTLKNIREVLPIIKHFSGFDLFKEIFPISALKNSNIAEYLTTISNYLPESQFYYDPEIISTQKEKFFVSELIREVVFHEYMQELPYSTEIYIQEFKERESGKWYISAEIIVERDTQKAIIIGEKGRKIKIVGEKARKEIEQFLDMPIFLELFVKVRDKWRDNKSMLKSFGY